MFHILAMFMRTLIALKINVRFLMFIVSLKENISSY